MSNKMYVDPVTDPRRYQIQKPLGSGGCGTALLVKDWQEGILKVLKEIHINDFQDAHSVEAEAELLKKMNHPNIVEYHDSFWNGDVFCIVMEDCEGGDLTNIIKEYKQHNKRIPEDQVKAWVKQILDGLQHMNKVVDGRRILHRDIKCQNLFLKNGQIKIGDFGISRTLDHTFDKANTVIGTPRYMAPERLNKNPYDEKSDIWSLGCVVYELCSLEPAFISLASIFGGPLPQLPKGYSNDFNNILQKMLERDSQQRPSASKLLCDLQKMQEKQQMHHFGSVTSQSNQLPIPGFQLQSNSMQLNIAECGLQANDRDTSKLGDFSCDIPLSQRVIIGIIIIIIFFILSITTILVLSTEGYSRSEVSHFLLSPGNIYISPILGCGIFKQKF